MERLKSILYYNKYRISSVESKFVERFLNAIIQEKDKKQAEVIYGCYQGFTDNALAGNFSLHSSPSLEREMERVIED